MGMVTSYGHLETRSNGARKMDVILTNARLDSEYPPTITT